MYVVFLLSKACVGPPWTKKSVHWRSGTSILKAQKNANTRAACRCYVWHHSKKGRRSFSTTNAVSLFGNPHFYDRSCIATRTVHCIIWHLITPKKYRALDQFDGMSSIQARPKYVWTPPKYLHDLENGSINFIESKTLPTTHLCFWQFTISYSRNHLVVFWDPELETSTTHSTQRSPVTPSDLDPSSNLHSWFFWELVSMATSRGGFSCWDLFIDFAGGNMYEVVAIPKYLTYTPKNIVQL